MTGASVGVARLPFYYGWVNLAVAALAMVGTLPGRTQGLGLITEPLLNDLHLDRVVFAQVNLLATLIGSLFCLGFGRLIDQFGSRTVLAFVAFALGSVLLAMSGAAELVWLFVLITLTRGLGQSALSVVSITIVGQWFARRLSLAMAIYTVALSVGFMIVFPLVGSVVLRHGWRVAWSGLGWVLVLVLAPIAVLLVRRSPEHCGLTLDGGQVASDDDAPAVNFTFGGALRTPAFWVFAIGSSLYNLVVSGIGLFNEAILRERGFEATVYHQTLAVTALTSLVGNFLGGWLAGRWSMRRLLSLAMLLLGGALTALPHLSTRAQVMVFAVVMGVAGGFVIVIFFTFWGRAYGRAHLGKIQGAAQLMTVLASAVGPLLLAKCAQLTGSYAAIFYALAAVVAVVAVVAWWVREP